MGVDVIRAGLGIVFQNKESGVVPVRAWAMASTARPTAKSLSATEALGIGIPGTVPAVRSLGRRSRTNWGTIPSLLAVWTHWRKWVKNSSTRNWSGKDQLEVGIQGIG